MIRTAGAAISTMAAPAQTWNTFRRCCRCVAVIRGSDVMEQSGARRRDLMPHISLGNDAPGIMSLLIYRPETARPLLDLAETLLRGPSSLTPGERELIAAYVSGLNDCRFCSDSHAAFAAAQLPEGMTLVDHVRADLDTAPISA